MSERVLPLHFQALRADAALPLAERTAELLHSDLQRWTRRYLRPLVRVVSSSWCRDRGGEAPAAFQFSWQSGLDWPASRSCAVVFHRKAANCCSAISSSRLR